MSKTENKWLRVQKWLADVLMRYGVINVWIWDIQNPNTIKMYRRRL